MSMNAIVVQCGGPTPVINASLAAVIEAWSAAGAGKLWGARWGLHGFAHRDWVDLDSVTHAQRTILSRQPGAALGSGRYRLADADIPATLRSFQDQGIGVVFMIGGNGTMGAAGRLSAAANAVNYNVNGRSLAVLGVPKTIDNDLIGTEVAPGYASAARFIAQTTHNVALDLASMRSFDHVAILETMGRHTGWLAAASVLARSTPDDPPHLILLPEAPVDEDQLLQSIERAYRQHGTCLVVASEGIRDWSNGFYAEKTMGAGKDGSGQTLLSLSGGVAAYLARLLQARLGLRCRQIRPDTIQRSTTALTSETDRTLALLVGTAAVDAALAGHSGVMVGVQRTNNGWQAQLTPVEQVHGRERVLPPEFMDADRFDVTPAFVAYCAPLVGELGLQSVRFG